MMRIPVEVPVLVVVILICIVVVVCARVREENRMSSQCDNCNHFRPTIPTLLPHPTRPHVTEEFRLCKQCRAAALRNQKEKATDGV